MFLGKLRKTVKHIPNEKILLNSLLLMPAVHGINNSLTEIRLGHRSIHVFWVKACEW